VLPAVLFRALIPVGFMPVVEAGGGLAIGFCPGEAALPPGLAAPVPAQHAAHHHQHHHSGGSEDPSTATHHAPCLFAASATPTPTPTIVLLPAAGPQIAQFGDHDSVEVFLPTILRAQSPRGPPVFS